MAPTQLDSVKFQVQTENFHQSLIMFDNIGDLLTLYFMQGKLPPVEHERVKMAMLGLRQKFVTMFDNHLDNEPQRIAVDSRHPLLSSKE